MDFSRAIFRRRGAAFRVRACSAALLITQFAQAQNPPVPPEYQDLYTSLNTYLTNFNTTLNAGHLTPYPVVYAGNLWNANANAGPQVVNAMAGVQLELQELKAMGVKSIMIEVGFPMLYEPFLTSQGVSYTDYANFYQQVAASVRAAGLKLIIENDTLLTNDTQAGWDMAPFYATLDWTQYQQARAQGAVTVAQVMQPDYLTVVQEPSTEGANSGQSDANTPTGSYQLLSTILASVKQPGVPGMPVGAGTGTSQQNFLAFTQQYVTLPVDYIDMHIYPVNRSFLPNALQIASTAAAAGKPVAMTESWLWKIRDNELGKMPPDEVRGRDPFDFWAPLDGYFLQTMENLANYTKMIFMAPMGPEYFAAYLPYDSTTGLTPAQILDMESGQFVENLQGALYTSTADSYYHSLVSPADKTAPSVPAGLTGASANPQTAYLTWSASTDDVGVAGYHVLRNGAITATTANAYFQDTGLAEGTSYTYTIEAFDLADNVSAPSLPVHVTTRDTSPPTPPGNLAVTAISCEKATLTWSASSDNRGVKDYLIFSGISPKALDQVGRTPGSITKFTSVQLTQGTTYYYGVEAQDGSGNTSAMSAIMKIVMPMPPAAPTNLTATPASGRISLAWSVSASGGLPVQNYHVYRGGSAAHLSQIAVVQRTSYIDQTVVAGTTYYYGIEAADSGADLSPMSTIVKVEDGAPPAAPGNLTATAISTSRIGLTWTAPAGGLPIRYYTVLRGSSPSTLVQLANTAQTAYTDSGLSAATRYYYALQAVDTSGGVSEPSAIVSAKTLALPSAPVSLTATAPSKAEVDLAWKAGPSGMPLASYIIYRGSSASNLEPIKVIAATKTTCSDYSVAAGVKYYYAVQAKDTGGNPSPMSAIVNVTTPK